MLKTDREIIFPLLKLAGLEIVRSVAISRNMLTGFFVFLIMSYLFLQLLGAAIFLGLILRNYLNIQDIPGFLSSAAAFYLFAEFILRFFFQKPPTFDFNRYLHLPIRRSGIVNFLFIRSFISFFTLIVIVFFTPITITDLSPEYGPVAAAMWLGTLFFLSISLHCLMLWIKKSVKGGILNAIAILSVPVLPLILFYFNLFDVGSLAAPFFYLSFSSPLPLIVSIAICLILYLSAFKAYKSNAYIDQTVDKSKSLFSGGDIHFLSQYGLAGKLANIELKMILRHKKSRGYLIVSMFLLLYGLFFYQTSGYEDTLFSALMYLFIGAFITGSFVLQYGQLLLSWNSAHFDFYMVREKGLEALIKSKYLLFLLTMFAAYILTLPYGYFGWEVIAYHTAALLYNAGIGVHLIIYMSLWEPKPMNINKGAMFNYDGVGISQFIMIIPYILVLYGIYIFFRAILGDIGSLFALGIFGLFGLMFQDKMLAISVKKLHRLRHNVSNSFRQEV